MADITVETSMTAAQETYFFARNGGAFEDTWGTVMSSEGVMKVSTSTDGEAIPLGEVSNTQLGWAWFRNLSASDTVEIGLFLAFNFTPLIKLAGGQFALVKLAPTPGGSSDLLAKASVNNTPMEYRIFQA